MKASLLLERKTRKKALLAQHNAHYANNTRTTTRVTQYHRVEAHGWLALQQFLFISYDTNSHYQKYTEIYEICRALTLILFLTRIHPVAPSCSSKQNSIFEVSLGETVSILCSVDIPGALDTNLTFSWRFINSLGMSRDIVNFTSKLPHFRAAQHDDVTGSSSVASGESVVTSKLLSPSDYGSYICYANNALGSNRKPCEFLVLPKLGNDLQRLQVRFSVVYHRRKRALRVVSPLIMH